MFGKLKKSYLLSTIAAFVLIGCGGGGGSSSGGTTSDTITGKAVDGYLQNSTVCLDLSLDGYCQLDSEPASTTKSDGSYTLKLTSAQKNHENFNIAQIIVYDGVDSDTGERFTGKLFAPNDGSAINVTPLTTLVVKSLDGLDKNSSKEDIEKKIKEAKDRVKKVLKLSDDTKIDDDPVELKKQNKEELISATIALQKSIETLAKAGSSDSTTNKNEKELIEDIFKAFASNLSEFDNEDDASKLGLDKLIDKTKEMEEKKENSLIPPKALKASETAKQIANKIETSLKNLDSEDELKLISSMIQEDLKNLEKEFEKFDGESDFTSSKVDLDIDDSSTMFTGGYDWEIENLKKKILNSDNLSVLSQIEINTLATDLKDLGVKAFNLYSTDTIELLSSNLQENENFEKVILEIKKELSEWEEEIKEEEIKFSDKNIAFSLPESFYTIDKYNLGTESNYINGYFTNEIKFAEDFLLTTNSKELKNGLWKDIKSEATIDYILNLEGNWEKINDEPVPFSLKDNKILIPSQNILKSLVKKEDISNKKIYLKDLGFELVMPKGAEKRYLKDVIQNDYIYIYNKTEYKDFEALMSNHCAKNSLFSSNNRGLSFGSLQSDGTYKCDSTVSSGNLLELENEKVIDKKAGVWEYQTIRGKKFLIIKPKKLKKYTSYADEDGISYFIYAEADVNNGVDKEIWRGYTELENQKEVFSFYNKIAFDTIKERINKGFNSLDGEEHYIITFNSNNSECIKKQTYGLNTLSLREYSYSNSKLIETTCSKNNKDKLSYKIKDGKIVWENGYTIELLENNGTKYKVKDGEKTFYIYKTQKDVIQAFIDYDNS